MERFKAARERIEKAIQDKTKKIKNKAKKITAKIKETRESSTTKINPRNKKTNAIIKTISQQKSRLNSTTLTNQKFQRTTETPKNTLVTAISTISPKKSNGLEETRAKIKKSSRKVGEGGIRTPHSRRR